MCTFCFNTFHFSSQFRRSFPHRNKDTREKEKITKKRILYETLLFIIHSCSIIIFCLKCWREVKKKQEKEEKNWIYLNDGKNIRSKMKVEREANWSIFIRNFWLKWKKNKFHYHLSGSATGMALFVNDKVNFLLSTNHVKPFGWLKAQWLCLLMRFSTELCWCARIWKLNWI